MKELAVQIDVDRITGKVSLRVCSEFGYDLQCAVPFAYWLHSNGKLGNTIGPMGSTALYYFNHHHVEDETCERKDNHVPDQMNPHRISNFRQWKPPDYKRYYQNALFVFNRPILFIHNKYAMEWHRPPVNFFSLPDLQFLFSKLSTRYKVIYHRPALRHEVNIKVHSYLKGYAFDNMENERLSSYNTMPLNDESLLKEYNISTLDDFAAQYPQYDFNEVTVNLL